MSIEDLTDGEFRQLQHWLLKTSGIYLNDEKKTLVSSRLIKRLRAIEVQDLADYVPLLLTDADESQIALNLLTTNETHFFREPRHFDFIREQVIPSLQGNGEINLWSAAASTGEEAYSLAMLFSDLMPMGNWRIIATDINTEVLTWACSGIYSLLLNSQIPDAYLQRFCLKGKGKDEGKFKIEPKVKQKVTFLRHNLIHPPQHNSLKFDLVLLRNVLIYFDKDHRKQVVQHVIEQMRPGGWLLTGLSESIGSLDDRLKQIDIGCYQYQP